MFSDTIETIGYLVSIELFDIIIEFIFGFRKSYFVMTSNIVCDVWSIIEAIVTDVGV